MRQGLFGQALLLLGLLGFAYAAAGCRPSATGVKSSAETISQEIELSLIVVDDPGIADAIGRLRGDWKARTGASVAITQMTSEELLACQSAPTPMDAIIYPSAQLGPLAERDWIAPLPEGHAGNADLDWPDVFELLQVGEARWGQVPYAVPFGSPVLTCFYRADLLTRLNRSPPRTWREYHELAELLGRRENLLDAAPAAEQPWHGTVEPLEPGWAGRVLLARAAAYAKHHDQYSTLFNIDSMEPLIGGPAFVRALEELVADAKLGPEDALKLDPMTARREFLAGHAALALSWPSRAGSDDAGGRRTEGSTGFVELPGSASAYNIGTGKWENRGPEESPYVPLLCIAGRLGSLGRASSYPHQALALLAWLSGRQWGSTVGSASGATTLFRQSQVRAPQPWLDPAIDGQAGQQYARSVRDVLSRTVGIFALRIEGQERYLAALDTAVEKAVRGQRPPIDALAETAAEWTRITEELGRDAQRRAYRKSLGLEP